DIVFLVRKETRILLHNQLIVMDHKKGSSSSFTENLFGPKDATPASSSGLFSSVFGPSSTGLGRDASSHSKNSGTCKQHEYRGPYGSGQQSAPEYKGQRSMGEKEGNPMYQNETAAEPSYLSSSIYYGGQEVYSPNTQTTRPHHTILSSPDVVCSGEDKNYRNDNIPEFDNNFPLNEGLERLQRYDSQPCHHKPE
ncbi:hypothetical protein Tco_0474810, partial [Tanacetum coccineum]